MRYMTLFVCALFAITFNACSDDDSGSTKIDNGDNSQGTPADDTPVEFVLGKSCTDTSEPTRTEGPNFVKCNPNTMKYDIYQSCRDGEVAILKPYPDDNNQKTLTCYKACDKTQLGQSAQICMDKNPDLYLTSYAGNIKCQRLGNGIYGYDPNEMNAGEIEYCIHNCDGTACKKIVPEEGSECTKKSAYCVDNYLIFCDVGEYVTVSNVSALDCSDAVNLTDKKDNVCLTGKTSGARCTPKDPCTKAGEKVFVCETDPDGGYVRYTKVCEETTNNEMHYFYQTNKYDVFDVKNCPNSCVEKTGECK